MAKTQETTAAQAAAGMMGGMGDLSVIRNILFGQQAAEFETQITTVINRLDKTDEATDQRFKKLEADIHQRIEALEKTMTARLQQLEEKLAETAAQLSNDIQTSSRNDRAEMGNLLIELGKKLV